MPQKAEEVYCDGLTLIPRTLIPRGDPSTVIVGLPDTAVKESKDRVHTAVTNSGFKPHAARRPSTWPLQVFSDKEYWNR